MRSPPRSRIPRNKINYHAFKRESKYPKKKHLNGKFLNDANKASQSVSFLMLQDPSHMYDTNDDQSLFEGRQRSRRSRLIKLP